VIPFENSTNGSVVQTLDLLADRQGLNKNITVCGEYFLTVEHCLIIRREPSSTTATSDHSNEDIFKSITKLYTHPQAWGQCEKFLGRYFKGIERQDVSSTSKAVEIVSKNDDDHHEAAIASRLAAEYHGAFVLQRHIEDRADNTTRFLILRNELSERSSSVTSLLKTTTTNNINLETTKKKTLISFMIEHSAPGALADALSVFKKHGLNLTSINSRPSLVRPWQYIFFVECEHVFVPTADGKICTSDILKELGTICLSCRDLGTWVDGRDLVT
jgi:prephenate dehydratase